MRILLLLIILISPEIVGGKPHLSKDFLSYIKVCENGIRKGWDKDEQKWFPYNDGSGWHIAYGHLIKKGDFLNGITEEQAQKFLTSDLEKAYNKAKNYFDRKGFNITEFSSRQVEIIVDFTFNGCLYSHPKFINAVTNSNLEGQRKEYKRYAILSGQRVELKDRNTRFYNRYLKNKEN